MKDRTKKVALLIYSCPFHFPPTINAANILDEDGYEVHLIGLENKDNWSQQLNPGVKVVYLGKMISGLKGMKDFIRSIFFLRHYLKKNNIGALIGYDAKSVIPSYFATKGTSKKWIFHQHDYWEAPRSKWESILWHAERRLTKHAYKVSFPQTQRAEYFQKVAHLKEMPLIVYNGPRRSWINHSSAPHPVVLEMRKKHKYILIYQGGWSAYFGLERMFDAVALCKTDVALIMLGEEREKGLRDSYMQYLQNLGISERVYLAEKYIPYEALPAFTNYVDAAVGKLTGEEDDAPFNDRFLIGAANKITEYIACGLPVILQESTPNRLFLEKYPIGILTNTNDKKIFSQDIDALLSGETQRKEISEKNKELFRQELNFDTQFSKIKSIL